MAKLDFMEGMYADNSAASELPRTESGSLRVAAFRVPCKTSKELEERQNYHFQNPIDVEFVDAEGNPEVAMMTPTEKAELSKHFTTSEWDELERILS